MRKRNPGHRGGCRCVVCNPGAAWHIRKGEAARRRIDKERDPFRKGMAAGEFVAHADSEIMSMKRGRNPGAYWHKKKEVREYGLSNWAKAAAHRESAAEAKKIGMPNPSRSRTGTRASNLLPLAALGLGFWWVVSQNKLRR